jgi:hypothetical protein
MIWTDLSELIMRGASSELPSGGAAVAAAGVLTPV